MRTCILALATAALFAILTAAFSENIYLDLAIANSCQQRYPTRVINFIQTRILITHHSCCRAGCRNSTKAVSVPLAQCDGGGILGYES